MRTTGPDQPPSGTIERRCSRCGAALVAGAAFCHHCGAEAPPPREERASGQYPIPSYLSHASLYPDFVYPGEPSGMRGRWAPPLPPSVTRQPAPKPQPAPAELAPEPPLRADPPLVATEHMPSPFRPTAPVAARLKLVRFNRLLETLYGLPMRLSWLLTRASVDPDLVRGIAADRSRIAALLDRASAGMRELVPDPLCGTLLAEYYLNDWALAYIAERHDLDAQQVRRRIEAAVAYLGSMRGQRAIMRLARDCAEANVPPDRLAPALLSTPQDDGADLARREFRAATLAYVKFTRANPTPAEEAIWEMVRSHRLDGLHIKQKNRFDRCVADYNHTPSRLIIMLDGPREEMRRSFWHPASLTGPRRRILWLRSALVLADLSLACEIIRRGVSCEAAGAGPGWRVVEA